MKLQYSGYYLTANTYHGYVLYIYREECGDPICQPVFWCKDCDDSVSGSLGSAIDSYGSPQAAPVGGSSSSAGAQDSYGIPQGAPIEGSSSASDSYGGPPPVPISVNGDSAASNYGSPEILTGTSSVVKAGPSSNPFTSSQETSNNYGSPQPSISSAPLDSYGSPPLPTDNIAPADNYGSPSAQPPSEPLSSDAYGSPQPSIASPVTAPLEESQSNAESNEASNNYGSPEAAPLPSIPSDDTYESPGSSIGNSLSDASLSSYGAAPVDPALAGAGDIDSLANSNNYINPVPSNVPSPDYYESPSSDTLSNSLSDSYASNTLGVASSATGSGNLASGQASPITFSPSPSTVPFGILKNDGDDKFLIDYSIGSQSDGGAKAPVFTVPSVLPPPDRKELDQLTPVNSHPHSLPHSSDEVVEGSGDNEVIDLTDGNDYSNLIPGDYIDDSYDEPDPDQLDDSIDTYKSQQQDTYQSLSSDFDYSYADSFTQYTNNNLMIDLRGRSRSDKNYGAPDLVVENISPISYGGGSRRVRFL